jgi:hypothetical protein
LPAGGLRLVTHRALPIARRRWIGVVPMPGAFNSHCLVMSRRDVLFDPARVFDGLPEQPPRQIRRWQLTDVGFGLSFQTITRKE